MECGTSFLSPWNATPTIPWSPSERSANLSEVRDAIQEKRTQKTYSHYCRPDAPMGVLQAYNKKTRSMFTDRDLSAAASALLIDVGHHFNFGRPQIN